MPEPLSSFYSTHLNNRIDSYPKLATRIMRQLGCPLIRLELAQDMAYEFIAMAIEHYTEYAGFTQEFLLFDSNLYRPGFGIQIDELVSTQTPELCSRYDPDDPNTIVGFDYDLEDYRRVVDVTNIEEGENAGTNILFTFQYAMMQQLGVIFYSGGMSKGFDLITWYNANEFLELRNKLLALKSYFRFDADNQVLKILPEPDKNARYWALVQCTVEKRVIDCLKNQWVQKYAMALTKIGIGNVRGKYNGVQLLGQGTINYNDLLSQGLREKEQLEEQLLTGNSGFAQGDPPIFIVQ